MIFEKKKYLDLFRVDERELEVLTAEGLRSGGSFCDLYFESTSYSDLLLRDGVVSSGGFHVDYGCGIRVLDGEKTGYSYTESTTREALTDAVRSAGSVAAGAGFRQHGSSEVAGGAGTDGAHGGRGRGSVPAGAPGRSVASTGRRSPLCCAGLSGNGSIDGGSVGFPGSASVNGNVHSGGVAGDRAESGRRSLYVMDEDWRKVPAARFLPYLERLESEIRRRDSRVIKVIAMLSDQVSDIMMYNSLGELSYETRPLGSISVSVIFQQGKETRTQSVSRSVRGGAEILSERLLQEVAQEAVRRTDFLFAARRPKGGRMPVVMGAGASGILLHEAMGHAFEADFNRKGQSIFSDRMGSRVCPAGISIVDDGTLPGNRGALNWDDEGVHSQKTYMVEDGILTSYLHDRISAAHYGVAPTGNGRRESFRYNPIPRMRATYMESGSDGSAEDIIRRVQKGIYVDSFANGQVKIGEGDFTFFVKSGFLIEDGRLTAPISDINIIGNGPEALSDIIAVGGDLKIDNGTWTCGKEQSVPVSCGMPTVLVKELTVGGE